jgi:RimJ/RimL family protein N-acetyltransferase
MCGLLQQTVNDKIEYEIGYHLIPRFWNQGFASESARHIRDWTFNYTDITSIISIILNENEPSEKVAVKNGMTLSGTTVFHDITVNIWRIDRKDWLNRLV